MRLLPKEIKGAIISTSRGAHFSNQKLQEQEQQQSIPCTVVLERNTKQHPRITRTRTTAISRKTRKVGKSDNRKKYAILSFIACVVDPSKPELITSSIHIHLAAIVLKIDF